MELAMNLQLKQSLNYLIYGAMVEIMLDTYSNTNNLAYFDSNLLTKHKNLLTNWKRESAKIYRYLEQSGNDEVIKQYHSIVNILESLMENTGEIRDFTELMAIIEEWQNGNLHVVEGG
jgi:hypothetical protein